jgi:hypothetical protein
VRRGTNVNDLVNNHREEAIQMVSRFLKLPVEITRELMPKLAFPLALTNESVGNINIAMDQLIKLGKMQKPLELREYVYPDLLRKVRPASVTLTLPR